MKFRMAAAGLALALVGGVALAQTFPNLILTSPLGTELVPVINSSPQKVSVVLNTIRNTTGYLASAATTGTVTTTNAVNNVIFTAALTGATTVDMPPSPPDGALFSVSNGTSSAFTQTITVATTDGSTIANGSTLATLAANSGGEWQYTASGTKWYRLR